MAGLFFDMCFIAGMILIFRKLYKWASRPATDAKFKHHARILKKHKPMATPVIVGPASLTGSSGTSVVTMADGTVESWDVYDMPAYLRVTKKPTPQLDKLRDEEAKGRVSGKRSQNVARIH